MSWKILPKLSSDSPPISCKVGDSIRVIGIGLPRTGGASLKVALEQLGFGPCHSMSELINKPDQSVQFARAYNGEKIDFRTLMEGYGSAVDCPTVDFYKEIHQTFPNAKLILTVRDSSEDWFESYTNSIQPFLTDDAYFFAVFPIRFLRLQCFVARKIREKWGEKYGSVGPWIYEKHNAEIMKENKDKNILIFNVKDGWEPLCKYLEVDIPQDIPFPKVNERKTMQHIVTIARLMGWCVWMFIGIIVAGALYTMFRLTS